MVLSDTIFRSCQTSHHIAVLQDRDQVATTEGRCLYGGWQDNCGPLPSLLPQPAPSQSSGTAGPVAVITSPIQAPLSP